jgi:hypothetical protein
MKNPSDIGINREKILANVFAKYLSNVFKSSKEIIFDSHGNKSHQLDIIISNNLMLHFGIILKNDFQK